MITLDLAALESGLHSGLEALGLDLSALQIAQLCQYASLINKWNKVYNLTALREQESILTHHLLDCLAVLAPLKDWAASNNLAAPKILDVGSGAGLPGLIIAICQPDWFIHTIDTVGKKTAFMQQAAAQLQLKNVEVFRQSLYKPHISYSVFKTESKVNKLLQILHSVQGSSIIYCSNRKQTKKLQQILEEQNIASTFYHAGLPLEQREQVQDNWIKNKVRVMVSTNAFGMGIDKADVRCVIHFDIPDTPEAYYQEMGRAGRDGLKSYAVVLYNQKDIEALKLGIEQKYPPLNTIKEIYQSLAYYFEVGIGSGNESVFDFEISDFCKKFDHQVIETLSSIKILEQQGFWAISESVYMPSKVSVIASKEAVTLFEERLPDYDEILKLLLRMYGGIWNHYIPIDEFLMAQKAQVSTDYIHHILQQLHKHHMIDYRQRRSNPQITYLHDRVDLMFLKIDMQLMATLKARYEERVHFMIDFITNRHTCKAKHLIAFFGEKIEDDCKICDNCLAYKKTLQADEFVRIKNTILQHISFHKSLHVPTFCKNLRSNEVEKTMKIINELR